MIVNEVSNNISELWSWYEPTAFADNVTSICSWRWSADEKTNDFIERRLARLCMWDEICVSNWGAAWQRVFDKTNGADGADGDGIPIAELWWFILTNLYWFVPKLVKKSDDWLEETNMKLKFSEVWSCGCDAVISNVRFRSLPLLATSTFHVKAVL